MNINKLLLPIVILLGCIILGGFYYATQISKQGSIEKQQEIKIEQEKQDQLSKEQKEQQAKEDAKKALESCLSLADTNYSHQWYEECKSQGKLTSECISLHEMTPEEYANQNPDDKIPSFGFIMAKSDCLCLLPSDNADRITETRQGDKDGCYKRYPQ